MRSRTFGMLAAVLGLAVLVGTVPLQVGAAPKISFPLHPPTWYHGDTWAWTTPRGSAVTLTVLSASVDGSYTISGMGAGVRPNMEWGAVFQREQVGNFLFLDWPLTFNKRWKDEGTNYTFVWRVGPVRTVTVPAGTFSTVQLLCSVLTRAQGNPPVSRQVGTGFAWYAPSAKTIVKIQFGPETSWAADLRNKAITLVKYQIH